eukprot:Lithocolla_globosa_v1_NODE_349_length_4370_cov_18.560371.p7 type:complete len:110 gc:universal NODE_349_length_4370_cov_18.560371:3842-3513(-)
MYFFNFFMMSLICCIHFVFSSISTPKNLVDFSILISLPPMVRLRGLKSLVVSNGASSILFVSFFVIVCIVIEVFMCVMELVMLVVSILVVVLLVVLYNFSVFVVSFYLF